MDVTKQDISRSHRIGKPRAVTGNLSQTTDTNTKPRSIIVKFNSYRFRAMVYGAKKKSGRGAYINEDLTRKRATIFYKSRQELLSGRFKHCWTNDGKIKVRLFNDSVKTISSDLELCSLISAVPINPENAETQKKLRQQIQAEAGGGK